MVRAGYRRRVAVSRGLSHTFTIGLPHVGSVSNYESHKTHFEGRHASLGQAPASLPTKVLR